jgi:hypothetical protein
MDNGIYWNALDVRTTEIVSSAAAGRPDKTAKTSRAATVRVFSMGIVPSSFLA